MFKLTCAVCGKEKGASKDRFEKWQIRLGTSIDKRYLCRECRRKFPKKASVTIPNETLKEIKNEKQTAELIHQLYAYQTLKKISI